MDTMVMLGNAELAHSTANTKHITRLDFVHWLSNSAPGDQQVYAIGDLAFALHVGGEAHTKLAELQEVTHKASNEGYVCLTQRRIQYFSESLKQSAVFEYVRYKRK